MALTDRIAAHARSRPDHAAVIFNAAPVSYAAFAGRIARTRAALARAGLGPGRLAVVCVHHLLNAWIVGLALRGAGVTTVNARSVEDAVQLAGGAGVLVTSAAEAGVWKGLSEAASAAGLSWARGRCASSPYPRRTARRCMWRSSRASRSRRTPCARP